MPLGDRDDPLVRPTARVILLDPRDRVMLIRATVTVGPDQGLESFWHMPGGLIEPGETGEQAASRECAEETGIRGVSVGVLRLASAAPSPVARALVRLAGALFPRAH